MPRRAKVSRRVITPDPKYRSRTVAKFINNLMHDGKKTVAQSVFYDALELVEQRGRDNPIDTFELALAQRDAGSRGQAAPRRWIDLSGAGRDPWGSPPRAGYALAHNICAQAIRQIDGGEAGRRIARRRQGVGATIKKKENTHRMAEANRAFAHYRF